MELVYKNKRLEEQCNDLKKANRLFDGNKLLAMSLLAKINALKNAETIKDIITQKHFRFHKLENKKGRNLEGYFSIDVKTSRDAWRIILQPLDENKNVYSPCNIDEIATCVRIVKIEEVSYHYE